MGTGMTFFPSACDQRLDPTLRLIQVNAPFPHAPHSWTRIKVRKGVSYGG